MEIKAVFEQCREKAQGNIFDFLVYIFEALEQEKGQEGEYFRQFTEQYLKKFNMERESEPVTMSKDQLVRLFNKYGSLVEGYIDYLVEERLEEPEFYDRLWKFINNREIFPDTYASKAAFMQVCQNSKIPYFYFPKRVLMENEEYRTYVKQVECQVEKLMFAMKCDYTQRTEKASVLWSILNEPSDENAKIVLLSSLLSLAEHQRDSDDD